MGSAVEIYFFSWRYFFAVAILSAGVIFPLVSENRCSPWQRTSRRFACVSGTTTTVPFPASEALLAPARPPHVFKLSASLSQLPVRHRSSTIAAGRDGETRRGVVVQKGHSRVTPEVFYNISKACMVVDASCPSEGVLHLLRHGSRTCRRLITLLFFAIV